MRKTANELKHLAAQRGWEVGPLTFGKIQRMSSDEVLFQEQFNGTEFNRALKEPQVKAENAAALETAKNQRMWGEQNATEEEMRAAERAVLSFREKFPQFRSDVISNRQAIIDWLHAKNLSCVLENIVSAFSALASKGQLVLNPSALGIGTEEEISGYKLMRHPELYRLLAPAPTAEKVQQRMSAKEWKEAHKEDWRETRVSDYQQKSWDQGIATFMLSRREYQATEANGDKMRKFISANGLTFNPQGLEAAFQALKSDLELNESNVIEGQATRYTNLGGSKAPGYPPRSEKYSFQHKIDSMTADELKERIAIDPSFRKALDGLG